MNEDKNSKKSKKGLFVFLIIFIILAIVLALLYFYLHKVKNKEMIILSKEERLEIYEKMEMIKEEPKKYEGVPGDKESPLVLKHHQSSNIIDSKLRIFPKVSLKLSDVSGFYRMRMLIYYRNKEDKSKDELIGYIQYNYNTLKKKITENFKLDYSVILDNLKSFGDYEGVYIDYTILVWDNNNNIRTINSKNDIQIIDNTAPKEIISYWTFFYNLEHKEIEMYNNADINIFEIYKTVDKPRFLENKVLRYEYGIKTLDDKVFFKELLDPFEDKKKNVEIDRSKLYLDGKYNYFVRAYDLNENFYEKKIKIFIDRTPPVGDMEFPQGDSYNITDETIIKLYAKDNLSGIFRYKLSNKKKDLFRSDWKPFKETVSFKMPDTAGVYEIWGQVQDNAMNSSEPFKTAYFVRKNKNINIISSSEDREKIIGIDKRKYKRGKFEINNTKEK